MGHIWSMKCHKTAIAAKIIEHLAKALGLSHGWLRFLYLQSPWEASPKTEPFVFYDRQQKWTPIGCDIDMDVDMYMDTDISHVERFTRTLLETLIYILLIERRPKSLEAEPNGPSPPGNARPNWAHKFAHFVWALGLLVPKLR